MLFIPGAFFDKSWRNLVLAGRSLWLHKMRTVLSVLGIIIGTLAVIVLLSFGEGSMQDALEAIRRQGATNIIVRSVKPPENNSNKASQGVSRVATYGLTEDDYDRLKNISSVIGHVPLRVFRQEIHANQRRLHGDVVGTTPRYAQVHKFRVAQGRFLHTEDGQDMKNRAVLGSELARKLFPFEAPLGQSVTIGKTPYVVVGVMASRMPTGGTGGSLAAEEFNDDVYIPLETCNARFGDVVYLRTTGQRSGEKVALHQVTLTISDIDKVRPTGKIIEDLLKRYHDGKQDYAVTVPLDKLEEAEATKTRYMVYLFIVGGISLVVGGIGIMNIMLATVTERTREIGIRRALGAKRRDITMQFLIESVVQTGVGGVLGVILGLGIVFLVPPLWHWLTGMRLPVALHIPSIFIAVTFTVVIGLAFGLYPAFRAARLDPIEALRHV